MKFRLLLLALVLSSCAYPYKAPMTSDGYRVTVFDSSGSSLEEHIIDTYREDPMKPEVKFKADDGRTIRSSDYSVDERSDR